LIDAKARAISQLLSRFGGRPKNGNKKKKEKEKVIRVLMQSGE